MCYGHRGGLEGSWPLLGLSEQIRMRRPADDYLAFFLMHLTLNPSECETLTPLCNTQKQVSGFPMQLYSVSIYLSPRLSSLFFLPSFCFYPDQETPEVFLVGKLLDRYVAP